MALCSVTNWKIALVLNLEYEPGSEEYGRLVCYARGYAELAMQMQPGSTW